MRRLWLAVRAWLRLWEVAWVLAEAMLRNERRRERMAEERDAGLAAEEVARTMREHGAEPWSPREEPRA